MPQIIVAKHNGFCPGVQRAVDVALAQSKGTYVLGEIIHNPQVVSQISERGLITVNSLHEVPNDSTVVFRSHGVPLDYYVDCKRRNIKIIDCTCSFVHRTQVLVFEAYKKKQTIIIIGDESHPEVIGLLGWCDNKAFVINDENYDFSVFNQKNLCVVSQTTFSEEKFDKIIKNIKKLCEKKVEVFKTICYTTIGRQEEASLLAKKCDAMLVIGGLNSSNTNKLYDLASKYCDNVFRLETADDLDVQKLKNFINIGIVSGASTPKAQTREVLLKMEEKSTEVNATSSMADALAKMDKESKFRKGQIVTATISQASDEGLLILLPYSKKEIALSKDELDCEAFNVADYEAKIGESIDLLVVELRPSLKLSQKMIRLQKEEDALSAEIEGGKEFTIVCSGSNKGGLVGNLGSYAVFVPAKEIKPGFVKDLTKYVGKTLRLRALEIKKDRKKEIIASQRVILQEEKDAKAAALAAKEAQFFAEINVGDVVEGKVERVTSFGAFVSVKGFDCLAHISDLSWTGCDNVSDVLEIGKTYEFKILKIEQESKKVSIGYKQLQPQPWELAAEKYNVGDVISGKVVRIVAFGAFVEVEKGIDGLVHVSQISHERIETPASVLNVGDEVEAKIIALDAENKKMNLSIKALIPDEGRKPRAAKENGDEEGRRAPRAARRNDDEFSDWSEGSVGTSIADLINAKKGN